MATDHPVYLDHALMVMRRHRDQFDWRVEGPSDWLTYTGGWCETRYAAKARREGRTPHQFRYRRR
jgi:tRNA (guanine-N7-)-methyltransferase